MNGRAHSPLTLRALSFFRFDRSTNLWRATGDGGSPFLSGPHEIYLVEPMSDYWKRLRPSQRRRRITRQPVGADCRADGKGEPGSAPFRVGTDKGEGAIALPLHVNWNGNTVGSKGGANRLPIDS